MLAPCFCVTVRRRPPTVFSPAPWVEMTIDHGSARWRVIGGCDRQLQCQLVVYFGHATLGWRVRTGRDRIVTGIVRVTQTDRPRALPTRPAHVLWSRDRRPLAGSLTGSSETTRYSPPRRRPAHRHRSEDGAAALPEE